MAYSTDIKDYWRRAWGLKDRPGFKYGGSGADWKVNYEDQMTFEEYLQMDLKLVFPFLYLCQLQIFFALPDYQF